MNQPRWNVPYSRPRERRVVVTGLGAVSAAGVGVPVLWQALLAGRSCISTIERYQVDDMRSRIGGEVKNFDPVRLLPARLKPKRIARQGQFAMVATQEAVRDAGLDTAQMRRRKCALVLGSSNCNVGEIADAAIRVETRGPDHLNPATVSLCSMQTQMSAIISMLELEHVPSLAVAGACTSGVDAVAIGSDMIRSGKADVVICGGTDSPLSRTCASAFVQAGMCSLRNDDPAAASRPFDRERDNGLIAEGAGVVILECLDEALDRGTPGPTPSWLGNFACTDPEAVATRATAWRRTMRVALQNSRCRATDIDYVSAWGCGDPTASTGWRRHGDQGRCSGSARTTWRSVRSRAVVGNPLAAAGVLQLVTIALSLRNHMLPPNGELRARRHRLRPGLHPGRPPARAAPARDAQRARARRGQHLRRAGTGSGGINPASSA